jgi:type I restriction enzyme M protein
MTNPPPSQPIAIIIQQGKLLDFIDGSTQRKETPEEYVRQEIAKSLVREYKHAKKDIAVEFSLPMGSKRPRADLAVFLPDAAHTPEEVRVILECKAKTVPSSDRKEGVGQLKSYMAACPNAEYGMWTNGLERFCYRKVVTGGKIAFDEIPDLPVVGQAEEDAERPKFDQLRAASSDALLFAFRRCHNFIAGNQGLQKSEAFWELLKLIFCKIHDEHHSNEVQFYASSHERNGINGQLKVKSRLDQLFTAVKSDFAAIFEQEEIITLTPPVLAYIVSQLQTYSLLDSAVDVKGRAYEEIVGANLRGDRGEFFTPRNVCSMAVAMLDPTESDLALDPACGTGGFLITVMNHVWEKIFEAERQKWHDDDRAEKATIPRAQKYAQKCIVGIDFNPHLIKAAKMNMVMNNDGSGGLYQANSLAGFGTWNDELRARKLLGKVDLLFTNPPFGANIKINDTAILEKYELARCWSYDKKTDAWTMGDGIQKSQPPEILFVERCVRFLKPGTGRAAIVLPDGILGSPGLGYVREWLFINTRILASIDLHPDTFEPDVGVQTSLLVLQRKTYREIELEHAAGKKADYDIFMAIANHVGHDKRGVVTYVRDAKGNEIVKEEPEKIREFADGRKTIKVQTTRRKVIDDNTLQIAKAFRRWLSEQS